MKPAIYKGVTYNVPLWTRWLAEDDDGTLCAYDTKPRWHCSEYWPSSYDPRGRVVVVTQLGHEEPVEVE